MRQQLKQLSGDTAIYGVSTIVQRFLSFLLTPFYTHVLSRAEVGIQATIYVMISLVMILANAGMEAAYFKYFSTAKTPEEKRTVFWNAFGVNLAVASLLCAAILLFPGAANTAAFLDLSPDFYRLIQMAGVIIFLDSISTVTLALLRMERKAKAFGTIKIAAISINVVLNIWLVAVERMGIEGVFISGIVQSLVQLLLTIPYFLRMFPLHFDRGTIDKLLRFGVPTIASGLAMIALQGIDRPIMKNLTDDSTVGLYQAGFRLGIPMMMFVTMFEFAWRPFFLQQADKPNARELFARIFTYFNLVAGFLFLSLSFYIVNLATMPIPFTGGRTVIAPNFWDGLIIIPIVLASYIFSGWYTNFIVGVYVEKKTATLPWITGLGAGIKIALCLLLIPLMGIIGGAWATFAAYLVMAFVLYGYIQKHYPIPYEWGRVAKIAVGVVVLWLANYLFLDFYDRSWQAALIRFGLLASLPSWLYLSNFFRAGEQAEAMRLLDRLRGRGVKKSEL